MATLENINQLRVLTGITSAGVGHVRSYREVADCGRSNGAIDRKPTYEFQTVVKQSYRIVVPALRGVTLVWQLECLG